MKKTNTIKAKQKFYDFCVKSGIDLKYLDVDSLQIHEIPPKNKSTFKNRASEVKKQFNHIFKMREQDFIGEFPNIEKLSFSPKN